MTETVRINDPSSLDEAGIASLIAAGKRVVVQFSRPGYSPIVLTELNSLCLKHGARLAVRFYGHYGEVFDATTLKQLTQARSLLLDCLMEAAHLEVLQSLQFLEEVGLGIYDLDNRDVLKWLPLSNLRMLNLGETRRPVLDLAHLSGCTKLQSLSVSKHTRSFDALGHLTNLHSLQLRQIGRRQSLQVLSALDGLKTLEISLGGREYLDELNMAGLAYLDVGQVQGLKCIDLHNFPKLRALLVTDQKQLSEISCNTNEHPLTAASIYNCPALSDASQLLSLPRLQELRLYGTTINFEEVLASGAAQRLEHLGFGCRKVRHDRELEAALLALGHPRRYGPIWPLRDL